ncbi:hypothetical protein SY88_01785 [Clostridiales bacterium PH28_bin88]|nr:hypothetical protein SY88_01785 [Clostridiales bacterium PH28_bin88]
MNFKALAAGRLDPVTTPELPQPDRVTHPEVAPPEVLPETERVEEPPENGGFFVFGKKGFRANVTNSS